MSQPFPGSSQAVEPVRLEPVGMPASRRALLLVMAAALSSVLGIARWLNPDERGYGTHEQLGLPPCAFRAITRLPCPSCGMTTSFAYAVRGRLVLAALTNPGGSLLAVAAALLIPWCLASAVVGRSIGIRSPERAVVIIALSVVAISVTAWAVRVLLFREQG